MRCLLILKVQDAIDAYSRAAELDPNNLLIKQRLHYLRQGPKGGEYVLFVVLRCMVTIICFPDTVVV